MDLVDGLIKKRLGLTPSEHRRPLFIWEPVPDLCTSEQRSQLLQALKVVDVVSPNHMELGALFEIGATRMLEAGIVEELSSRLLSSGISVDDNGAIVVRVGKKGCYFAGKGYSGWLPSVHATAAPKLVGKVEDPTGAGNAFLGGLAIQLVRSLGTHGLPSQTAGDLLSTITAQSVREACIAGNIAASFAIEQIGLPILSQEKDSVSDKIHERWNNFSTTDRIESYVANLK
jgi:sugar/nucleoside kinase (ribokinase family)